MEIFTGWMQKLSKPSNPTQSDDKPIFVHPHPGTNEINQKLLKGVQGDGFLEKSSPGHASFARRTKHMTPNLFKNDLIWIQ